MPVDSWKLQLQPLCRTVVRAGRLTRRPLLWPSSRWDRVYILSYSPICRSRRVASLSVL